MIRTIILEDRLRYAVCWLKKPKKEGRIAEIAGFRGDLLTEQNQ